MADRPQRFPSTLQSGRLVALDHLRGFVVGLVVLHHAMLAYCHFGHFDRQHYLASTAPVIDPDRWIGFDVLVLLDDSFFMPLMFLLSGLFVWRSLSRKRPGAYLRDRLLHLGVPFAVAVLTIVPLAYYPSFRLAGTNVGFGVFWVEMIARGPWPSGPPWFIAVLLVFDAAAAVLFCLVRRGIDRFVPLSGMTPARCLVRLIGVSALLYLPLLGLFGAARWLSFGPFAVQASRIGLYAVYFGAGVACGIERDAAPVLGALAKRWAAWVLLAGLMAGLLVVTQAARLAAGSGFSAVVWSGLSGVALIVFCAAACFALAAVFIRFGGTHHAAWDSLAANAYVIYLLHYPIVTWSQYSLLGTPLGAAAKAGLVFAGALGLSWTAGCLLRRMPGAAGVV